MLVGIRGTSARPPLCDYRGPLHTVAQAIHLAILRQSCAGQAFRWARFRQSRTEPNFAGSTLSIPL